MDMDNILKVFSSLSLSQLHQCKEKVDEIIRFKRQTASSLSVCDFVESHLDFVGKNSVSHNTILSEVESLGFKSSSDKTVTKWLTSTGRKYTWSSSGGKGVTEKDPIDINDYPGINQLMSDINAKFGTSLNSCLASYYKSGSSSTRYHSDDETSLDRSQGLYVVSFGAERTIDFHPQESDKRCKPEYSFKTSDCSLYVMKPGCQDFFVHRVRNDSSSKDARFSLSFRCMLPSSNEGATTSVDNPSVVNGNIAFCTPTEEQLQRKLKPKKRKTTVLFGTSMTKFVRTNKLGFRGRKVINVSQSGARIVDVRDNVRKFYSDDNAAKDDDIEKIIFSVGTNDVKSCKFGVDHLKKHLVELAEMTKQLFPHATVLFQACLPIRCMYTYIAKNVVDFNRLLKELCFKNNCIFIDCFKDFLTWDLRYANKDLYYDWLHLNNHGLGVLVSWIKHVVNRNYFDYRIVDKLNGL